MAVYQTSGISYELSNNNYVVVPADVYNNISGQQGVKFLRLINTSDTEVSTVTWTLASTTYTFIVAPDEYPPEQIGSGLVLKVVITYNTNTGLGVYNASIVDGGLGYIADPTASIIIYKENLGDPLGTDPSATNLNFKITEVDENGTATAIGLVAGNGAWPQTPTGVTKLLPLSETTVQVVPSSTIPDALVLVCASTLPTYAEVVNVIG